MRLKQNASTKDTKMKEELMERGIYEKNTNPPEKS